MTYFTQHSNMYAFLSEAYIGSSHCLLIQTAADHWNLLNSNQLESSRPQSPGPPETTIDRQIHEESPSAQSRQMIALTLTTEMMNQSTSRAQATTRSLAHILLLLAVRTPAHPDLPRSDTVVSFSHAASQTSSSPLFKEPGRLKGARQVNLKFQHV